VLATAGSALVLVLAWLLFPIVARLTLGLFAEDLVAMVERRHYPELPPAPGMSMAAQAYASVRFVTVGLLLNLIALPLYLLPVANLVLPAPLSPRPWYSAGPYQPAAGRGDASGGSAAPGSPGGDRAHAVPVFNLVAPWSPSRSWSTWSRHACGAALADDIVRRLQNASRIRQLGDRII
jgi:hypothetical protein